MAAGIVLIALGFAAVAIGVTGNEGRVWTMITNQPYPFQPANALPPQVNWYPSWLPHPSVTVNGQTYAAN